MKKWISFFCCMHLIIASGAQPPGHLPNVTGDTRTKSHASFLTALFNHGGNFGLPENGTISGQLNNKLLFESATKKQQLHGRWESWYQDGLPCDSGTFQKGVPDGIWKHWDQDGNLIALRTYNADKFQRVSHAMLRYHSKRSDYPLAVMYAKSRQQALHFMSVSASFPHVDSKGFTLKELVTSNITAGNVYRPVFDRALHHGLYINFFPGGAVKDSGLYQNGLRHGLWLHSRENGETESGTYHHGIKVKEWRAYNANGKLTRLTIYTSSGKIRKTREFD